jgi:hypothetical protein
MKDKDDDKPTISLAVERKARERDFAAERELLIKELLEIGQSPERASAIVADLLLIDWWCLQATVILARWDLEQDAEAAVELVKIMARGPRDGDDAAAPCSPPASPALPPTTPRGQAKRHRVATRLLAMAGDLANQRPSP